jgi:hypothetical protein
MPVCRLAFAVVRLAFASRMEGTIFPGVTGPAATVLFFFAEEFFAGALLISDFFVIAIVNLLLLRFFITCFTQTYKALRVPNYRQPATH